MFIRYLLLPFVCLFCWFALALPLPSLKLNLEWFYFHAQRRNMMFLSFRFHCNKEGHHTNHKCISFDIALNIMHSVRTCVDPQQEQADGSTLKFPVPPPAYSPQKIQLGQT